MTSQLDFFAPSARPAGAATPKQPAVRVANAPGVGAAVLDDEAMAHHLEASGNYRILRKLPLRSVSSQPDPGFQRKGIILDTETTGLNHRSDEIIEIGVLAFTFDDAGRIGEVTGVYGGLRQPGNPIPADITRLTGITDDMVAGQAIDMDSLQALIDPAELIIAHNAGFDRPFCEAFSAMFERKAWACSVAEVDWSARGFEGSKLGYLIGQAGYFHEGHRAVDDCFALLEVLARQAGDVSTPFVELYEASKRSRVRIYAENSPFDLKDHLKARGYRWSDGTDGRPKAWWTELAEEQLADELRYLRTDIYRWKEADPPIKRLTAFDRFKAK